jgi:hypothetical protein
MCVDPANSAEKRNRVAEWTSEVLSKLLEEVMSSRISREIKSERRNIFEEVKFSLSAILGETSVIDEVSEVIELPNYTNCLKNGC